MDKQKTTEQEDIEKRKHTKLPKRKAYLAIGVIGVVLVGFTFLILSNISSNTGLTSLTGAAILEPSEDETFENTPETSSAETQATNSTEEINECPCPEGIVCSNGKCVPSGSRIGGSGGGGGGGFVPIIDTGAY